MSFKGYPRFPTIHGSQIVFTAEDDLWLLGDGGGRAERLTASVAEATNPRFSPDAQSIAFTGRDEGPAEVYIMPIDGGTARRLTFHGGNAVVAGWDPGGEAIVFASDAGQPRFGQRNLFSVWRDGGEPEPLPFGVANAIAYGPGDRLVLGRYIGEPARWKRYRGGTVGHLWVDPDGSRQFKRLLDFNTNVSSPCWIGDRIYFISDHEGIGNVYSCLPTGEDLQRHTSHEDYYARSLSTDGERLVYHAGGELYLLDTPSATGGRRLEVELTGTRAQRSRKFVAASKYLDSWSLQPQGNWVALTARGKAFSLGSFEGPILQHGDPDSTRYRLLSWMADGKRLVGIADDGSEPRLVVFSSATGAEPPRVLENLDIGTVAELRPSPVEDKVVLLNHRSEVLLVDLAAETLTVVDKSDYARTELASHTRGSAWSLDGRWIAYAYATNPQQTAIKIYNVATGESEQVTDPILHDTRPAFDPGGRYLYFLSAREFDPVMDNLHFGWSFPKGVRPYLVTLQHDLRSPFTPEPAAIPLSPAPAPTSDASPAVAAQSGASPSSEPGAETSRPIVRIDFEGIRSRIVALPVPEGRYGRVQGTHTGVVYSSFPVESAQREEQGPSTAGSVDSYHFEQHKSERLLDGISDFEVNARGTTLIYQAGERLRIVKAGEKPPHLEGEAQNKPGRESGWIDLDRVQVSVRPDAEWRQMLGEAWRLQREQFWNADMSGTDWPTMYQRYSRLLDRIGSRSGALGSFLGASGRAGDFTRL